MAPERNAATITAHYADILEHTNLRDSGKNSLTTQTKTVQAAQTTAAKISPAWLRIASLGISARSSIDERQVAEDHTTVCKRTATKSHQLCRAMLPTTRSTSADRAVLIGFATEASWPCVNHMTSARPSHKRITPAKRTERSHILPRNRRQKAVGERT